MNKRRRRKLLVGAFGPDLEQHTRSCLARMPLPEQDDEFDRVCREAMLRYLEMTDDFAPAPPNGIRRPPSATLPLTRLELTSCAERSQLIAADEGRPGATGAPRAERQAYVRSRSADD